MSNTKRNKAVYDKHGNLKSNIYLDPKYLQECYKDSIENGECSGELLECFQKIAEEYVKIFPNTNDCDRRACINYAMTEAWLKWNKYDPTRSSNVFAFYTSMIGNDLKIHYNFIKRHNKTKISLDSLTFE